MYKNLGLTLAAIFGLTALNMIRYIKRRRESQQLQERMHRTNDILSDWNSRLHEEMMKKIRKMNEEL